MGIFGTTEPKYITVVGSTTVALPYSQVISSEPSTDYVEQRSELTGERQFLPRGTHWVVEIQVNLWKYSSPTPATKYATIAGHRGAKVYLYLHSDGNPFYKSAGVSAAFVLKEVSPKWVTDTDYKDILILRFESADTIYQG